MRAIILAQFLLLISGAAHAGPGVSLVAGSHVNLQLPPVWDEDTKTGQSPDFIAVQEAGSIESCSFAGGPVTVKKVDGDQVFFDPAVKSKAARCSHLVAPMERFRAWFPETVAKLHQELKKKQETFRVQLNEDVKAIVEKGGDPCTPQDRELKTGNVYKIAGRVYTYGSGTAATSVAGKSCQVELGSLVEILGFNRASDHVVAEYHRPTGSPGEVLVGTKRIKAATCADGENVVFSLSKLKEHFQFAEPTTRENLEVKGIAAVLTPKPKICINETGEKSVANGSRSHKRERASAVEPAAESAEQAPDGDVNSAR
jgi:hypothetical protein